MRKGVADILWENLVLALIGDQFEEEDLVCGCVLSVRSQEDIISVWHQDEKKAAAKERIKYVITANPLFYSLTKLQRNHKTLLTAQSKYGLGI